MKECEKCEMVSLAAKLERGAWLSGWTDALLEIHTVLLRQMIEFQEVNTEELFKLIEEMGNNREAIFLENRHLREKKYGK